MRVNHGVGQRHCVLPEGLRADILWSGHGPNDARFWTWQDDEMEGLATVGKVLPKSSDRVL